MFQNVKHKTACKIPSIHKSSKFSKKNSKYSKKIQIFKNVPKIQISSKSIQISSKSFMIKLLWILRLMMWNDAKNDTKWREKLHEMTRNDMKWQEMTRIKNMLKHAKNPRTVSEKKRHL